MYFSEIIHFIRHLVKQEMQATRTHFWGHISSYNPVDHSVKVLIPSLRDQDGNMYETSDLPLGTMRTGPNWGMQYAPALANATMTNLIGGEQVQVALHDRKTGVGAITKFAFNVNHRPPGAGNADGSTSSDDDATGTNQLKPGEYIDKWQCGTFFKVYADGHMAVFTQDKFVVNTTQECDLNVLNGNLNVDVKQGNANILVEQGAVNVETKVGNINATADEGNIVVLAKLGNIQATATTGAIVVTAVAGPVALIAGTTASISAPTVTVNTTSTIGLTAGGIVTISAPGIDLASAIIDAGSGAVQQLLNAAFLVWANSHTHVSGGAGSLTSVPVAPAVLGIHSTNNLEGS